MQHIPVLLEETLTLLEPALAESPGALVVDCTVGLGGHAEALLERFPAARLVAVDRDPQALELSRQRLERFGDRVSWMEGNFHQLASLWFQAGLAEPRAMLADLGVSSMQLDVAERGFSFRKDGPLDMRMGSTGITAQEVVNEYSEAELMRIIRDYGEERRARRIARAIVEERERGEIVSTGQLRELIGQVKGGGGRDGRVDPATRAFQALRIEVNEELSGLEGYLEQAVELLSSEGRLVIISYHSLEDRIVKNSLRQQMKGQVDPVTGRPLAEQRIIEVLTKKPVRPSSAEVAANPRARSARLRAARKL